MVPHWNLTAKNPRDQVPQFAREPRAVSFSAARPYRRERKSEYGSASRCAGPARPSAPRPGVRRPDRGLDRAVDRSDSFLIRLPVAGFGAELKGRFETEGSKHRRPIDWSLQSHTITKWQEISMRWLATTDPRRATGHDQGATPGDRRFTGQPSHTSRTINWCQPTVIICRA
jgi:hypothetical protein